MVAASFPLIETARVCRVPVWNVRNMWETNGQFRIGVGMVKAIQTVCQVYHLGFPFQMTAVSRNRRECCTREAVGLEHDPICARIQEGNNDHTFTGERRICVDGSER